MTGCVRMRAETPFLTIQLTFSNFLEGSSYRQPAHSIHSSPSIAEISSQLGAGHSIWLGLRASYLFLTTRTCT